MTDGQPDVGDVLMHSNQLICLVVRELVDEYDKRMVEVLWLDEPDPEEDSHNVSRHYGYKQNWQGWVLL